MNQKPPKPSKEQIAQQMKQKAEVLRHRKLAKEVLFPALANTENLIEAQQACEILQTTIQAAMMKPYKEAKLEILKLDEELHKDEKNPRYKVYEVLIEGLKDVNIQDAMKVLQGMGGAIDGYIKIQARKQKFGDLKETDLIRE